MPPGHLKHANDVVMYLNGEITKLENKVFNKNDLIAYLEAQLEKQDLLTSFSKFDMDGDGYLTKEEVVAMLTRDTGAGTAMTREAAERKWDEWLMFHDADSDGKLSYKEVTEQMPHDRRHRHEWDWHHDSEALISRAEARKAEAEAQMRG